MWVLIAGGQNTPGSEDREERGVSYEKSRGLKTEGLGLKGMGGWILGYSKVWVWVNAWAVGGDVPRNRKCRKQSSFAEAMESCGGASEHLSGLGV